MRPRDTTCKTKIVCQIEVLTGNEFYAPIAINVAFRCLAAGENGVRQKEGEEKVTAALRRLLTTRDRKKSLHKL